MPTYPQTGTLALPVLPFGGGAALVTPNLSYTLWEMCVEVAMPAVVVPLPAGTWEVEVIVTSAPGSLAGPTATWSSGSRVLASAGSITTGALSWRGYRNIDGTTQTVYAQITVMQNVAGTWKQYASTLATASPPTLSLAPPDAYSPAALPKMGSNLNVTYTGTGPYTPTPDLPGSLHKYIDAMGALGMNVVRFSIPWILLNFSGSTFDANWRSVGDDIFAYADSKGLKAYTDFGLMNIPSWAGTGATLTANRQAFLNTALARWGAHFAAVSVHNEPNNTGSFDSTGFVAALKDLYTACRAYNAALPVVAGDLAGADSAAVQAIYAAGGSGFFDGVGVHPYNFDFTSGLAVLGDPMLPVAETDQSAISPPNGTNRSLVGGLAAVHEVMRTNGDGTKTIWSTEFGWPTDYGASPGQSVDDSTQAAYLTTAFRQAARIPYCAAMIQYRAYDVVNPNSPGYEPWGGWNRGGFMRDDSTHKTSYAALQTVIANLKAGTG